MAEIRATAMLLLVLNVFAPPAFAGRPRQAPPPNAPAVPRVTDRSRPDFGYAPWAGSELTVVVVLSTECQDCVPFYKQLRAAVSPSPDRKLVFMARDGIWPVATMIEQHPVGFRPDRVVSYPHEDRFQIHTVPTVIVFDGTWTQKGKWEGRLDHASQQVVIARIESLLAAGASRKREGA